MDESAESCTDGKQRVLWYDEHRPKKCDFSSTCEEAESCHFGRFCHSNAAALLANPHEQPKINFVFEMCN